MNEIEQAATEKQGEGGGGSSRRRRNRRERRLNELTRCQVQMENGKRCGAAKMRHSLYCVFHDPEMLRRRRQLMFPIPYEHPDEIQWLLRDAVEDLKSKKLNSKEAYALGYLVTLLMQNQPRVEAERDRLDEAPVSAEVNAAVTRWMVERGEWKKKQREAQERAEAERAAQVDAIDP